MLSQIEMPLVLVNSVGVVLVSGVGSFKFGVFASGRRRSSRGTGLEMRLASVAPSYRLGWL